jgi:type IV secretion system protein VirB9
MSATVRVLLITIAMLAGHASAAPLKPVVLDEAAKPIRAPKENRIVKYTYSPDVIFRIVTSSKRHTHLELGEDEGVEEIPVIGESAQWRVTGGPRNLYIKPLRDDLETSFTVVTEKRTYQFQLISGSPDEAGLMQKVSFIYPDRDNEIRLRKQAKVAEVAAEQSRLDQQLISKNIDPAALDFSYEIQGDAPFKPTTAYSDGRFTYLVMPHSQDHPAILVLDQKGNPALIDYQVKDRMVVIERVADRLLLKLGSAEVRVFKRATHRSGEAG